MSTSSQSPVLHGAAPTATVIEHQVDDLIGQRSARRGHQRGLVRVGMLKSKWIQLRERMRHPARRSTPDERLWALLRHVEYRPEDLQSLNIAYPYVLERNAVRADGPTYDALGVTLRPATPPARPATSRRWTFLGSEIGFPIGVPASALTRNAASVLACADQGYSVLTYKTVRSRSQAPFDWPNWAFLSRDESIRARQSPADSIKLNEMRWYEVAELGTFASSVNSFGVESSEPDDWKQDIRLINARLTDSQLLIVSVLGDDYDRSRVDLRRPAVVDDFVTVTGMAVDAGASTIELNLSSPNFIDDPRGADVAQPALCADGDLSASIVRAVRTQFPTIPLVVKLAALPRADLERLLISIDGLVQGVAGINALPRKVMAGANPYFRARQEGRESNRHWAGLSGWAVNDAALRFVWQAAEIRSQYTMGFDLIGMGGVTDPAAFELMYSLGADVVQISTGASVNPNLGAECIDAFAVSLPRHAGYRLIPDDKDIIEVVERAGGLRVAELIAGIDGVPEMIEHAIDRLVDEGQLIRRSDLISTSGY